MEGYSTSAIAEAKELAATGQAWLALSRLQQADIEEVLLRLLSQDIGDLPRSQQDDAVGHALTKLYEEWRKGTSVRTPLAWLKVAARRRASSLRTRSVGEVEFDLERDDRADDQEEWDDDYVTRRRVAAEVGRRLLPGLGMPSVIDVMTTVFDLVAAGEDAKPFQIAAALDMESGTVRQHMRRGFERLASRAADRDLDELIKQVRAEMEES